MIGTLLALVICVWIGVLLFSHGLPILGGLWCLVCLCKWLGRLVEAG